MKILKQSTAATIVLGPFVDNADGYTPEPSLTITRSEVRLSKNAGTFAQKNESSSLTAMETNGYYSCALDTTDTGTLGRLTIAVNESGALPVWEEYTVVPANVYDSIVAGSDVLDVSVTQWLGTAAATPTVAGVPEVDITHINGGQTDGYNAILKLNKIDVQTASGDAVKFLTTADDGVGFNCKGDGGGANFEATNGNYAGLQTIGFGGGPGQKNTGGATGPGTHNRAQGGGSAFRNEVFGGDGHAVHNSTFGSGGAGHAQYNQVPGTGTGDALRNETTSSGTDGVGMRNISAGGNAQENNGKDIGVYNFGEKGGQKNEATAGSYHGMQNIGYGAGDGQKNEGGILGRGLYNLGGATGGEGQKNEAQAGTTTAGMHNKGYQAGAGQKNEGGGDWGIGQYNFGEGGGTKNEATLGSYHGLQNVGIGDGAGQYNVGGTTGRDIYAREIGAKFNLDGVTNAGILEILKKIVDDNSGADYDATTDSLHAIRARGDAAWGSSGDYVRTGTCQAGSAAGTIVLDASASASNDYYNDCLIWVDGGTGAGQVRYIQDYNGTTKACTISPNWTTTPDGTSTFKILPFGRVLRATLSELGVAQPSATPPIEDALMFHYMYGRNKATEDGSWVNVYNDAGAIAFKMATSQSGGLVTKDKAQAGT